LCAGTTPTDPFQPLASNGTVGQILTSNGTGLPSFQTLTPPFSPKYFILSYTVPFGNPDNPGFLPGATVPRELNTLVDPEVDLSCTLTPGPPSSFTLQPGTWLIYASAPGLFVGSHKITLYDVTNTTTVLTGTSEYANAFDVATRAFLSGALTIATATEYQLNHTVANGYVVGQTELGFPTSVDAETYTVINLTRIA